MVMEMEMKMKIEKEMEMEMMRYHCVHKASFSFTIYCYISLL